MSVGVVIVGAGAAGVHTAVALRERGYTGSVTLVGGEPHRPYDRPPLSKAVLRGQGRPGDAVFDIDFEDLGIGLAPGRTARAVVPGERRLVTSRGDLAYETLVIATGADPVRLPGAPAHVLRTLDDAERLRAVLDARGELVIIGAGWIGAELTTAAREAGCRVTVVEAAGAPLGGALPAEVAAPMAAWYAEAGAELRTGTRVAEVETDGVRLADGTRLRADAVVVGVGARPATDWLAGSGIALGARGEVAADAHLRASVPDVYAVGDCASFPSARYGQRLLVHHWDNAMLGARAVAAHIAQGPGTPVYDPVPYFWSEQFGRVVQYAGHAAPGDTVVWRGAAGGRDGRGPGTGGAGRGDGWSVCWTRGDRLTAVLAVDRPRDLAHGRRLITSGAAVEPRRVADPDVPLKAALREHAASTAGT
ncbi:FAD-dependent oxidoreductase [Streptomyces sp. NPDC000987]|uniref:NAD(P)/FAD-dependent oxidoreductase n=1 Tax=Streptomyces sp. NPDC000987 TaxID=3154374 RepID=UPI003330CAAB